jgi:flagellar basal-body rod protein FlgF
MQNAQLVSLSRQVALQRQMDVVANNMANLNTSGFKAEDLLFEQYDMPGAADNEFPGSQSVAYTQDWATVHDMNTGPLERTGNPLDVALSGQGFLTVATAAGNRYTRSGSLAIDAQGNLVDLNGNQVLGSNGPIHFDSNDAGVTIAKDGTVSTSQGIKDKLAVVEFANPQLLTRDGSNLWAGQNPQPATNTVVEQGSIEQSNVSGVTEITQMIQVQRAYQQLATLMQQQDQLRTTALQKLGSLTS